MLGPQAMEALRCVWLTAEGIPEAGMDACYCCGQPWTWERVPRLCLVLHVSLPESAMLTFACEACANDQSRLTTGLESGVRRDFFGGARCRSIPVSAFSTEEGRT